MSTLLPAWLRFMFSPTSRYVGHHPRTSSYVCCRHHSPGVPVVASYTCYPPCIRRLRSGYPPPMYTVASTFIHYFPRPPPPARRRGYGGSPPHSTAPTAPAGSSLRIRFVPPFPIHATLPPCTSFAVLPIVHVVVHCGIYHHPGVLPAHRPPPIRCPTVLILPPPTTWRSPPPSRLARGALPLPCAPLLKVSSLLLSRLVWVHTPLAGGLSRLGCPCLPPWLLDTVQLYTLSVIAS